MRKRTIFLGCTLLFAGAVSAQKLTEGYITTPESTQLHNYISNWNGGNGKITVRGESNWEDENFYISRVKPKERFFNTGTQVRPNLVQWSAGSGTTGANTDKRYVNWVPINSPEFNALADGTWDSDVFSMWSYVDHYGNWTAPYGWVPGVFADVAHKNGVAVSGVASVPYGGISSDWNTTLTAMGQKNGTEVAKFLYYHGVDGLGYNSEFNGYSPSSKGLITMHNAMKTFMEGKNPIFENLWYAGTNDNGTISFDTGIGSFTGLYNSASMFLNYNWNNTSYMTSSISTSESMGKSPMFIYAGMNQQGGEPKSGNNYSLLKDYKYGIGIWGAHSYNMFWEGRNAGGATVDATQSYYLDITERWYTGAARNPAVKKEITTVRDHRPKDNWAGISAMVTAKSTLNWDLAKEPFYTYFNLGNGKFFNYKGERMSDNQWYNIGMQDYLPTWRFWFAPEFLGGQTTAGLQEDDLNLEARFTWDDAYFGGSCLKISGTTEEEWLHLFKTDFAVKNNYKIRVIYKLLGGKADITLALGKKATDGTAPTVGKSVSVLTVDNSAEAEDKSYEEGWQVAEVTIAARDLTSANLNNGISVVALQFENAENMELLLGGLEILPNSTFAAPAQPEITLTKVLSNNYAGVDGKIIWNMPNNAGTGEPVYNLDVNTAFFKVYAQEQGGEPQLVGTTTSWAAIAFRSPNTGTDKTIRFGVSAVSLDLSDESEIAWGEYLPKGEYTASDEVVVDKPIIKANEKFTCLYVDPNHESSTWTLENAVSGETVKTGEGVELVVEEGLPLGGYNLILDKDTGKERSFGYFVQITSDAVGALPQIHTISRNGDDVTESGESVEIELTDTPTLSYTGRPADGSASRCLALNSAYIGASVADLGIGSLQPLSVAGWFKFDELPASSWNFMNVSNKAATWPQNTWGWAWNYGTSEGRIFCTFRGNYSDSGTPGELHYTFPDTRLQAGVWTHIAWIVDYNSDISLNGGTAFRCQLYINGVKQQSTVFQFATGNNGGSARSCQVYDPVAKTTTTKSLSWSGSTGATDDDDTRMGATDGDCYVPMSYAIAGTDRVYFGGAKHQGSAIDGVVDDFQIWNKAMTQDDVTRSMNGITADNLPDGLLCMWTFEEDTDDTFQFKSIGSKQDVNASSYTYNGNAETGNMVLEHLKPVFQSGCPFLSGTAYPIVTSAVWSDSSRGTVFAKAAAEEAGEDTAGSTSVTFSKPGDHTVTLTLENGYGNDSKEFPVFSIAEPVGVEETAADAGLLTYTVDNVLFLEFAAAGNYNIQVYNTAGALVGNKTLTAAAGQNARITLGNAGVYVVKVVCDGKVLRTVKVLSK